MKNLTQKLSYYLIPTVKVDCDDIGMTSPAANGIGVHPKAPKYLQSLPKGLIFSDFGPQSDFLEQIGLRKVRFWAQKSDFKSFRQHQLHFSTVLVQNGGTAECISESSKLILAGINTNYLAQLRGAQLCLNLPLGLYQAGSEFYHFLSHLGPIWSDFNEINGLIKVRFWPVMVLFHM